MNAHASKRVYNREIVQQVKALEMEPENYKMQFRLLQAVIGPLWGAVAHTPNIKYANKIKNQASKEKKSYKKNVLHAKVPITPKYL